ncbi:MAG: type II methionyl aminopeptidase [Nanoarchaeota archaeon]|nr:type II methionyl aminopeptidase [Nanoarchaeota archaeon]MBU4300483.1 type II methionyl aminopeptidase [Nanoarchaeota archaeon]MBU4451963.1 type II methionyl aminopeptidase [Nanoarchaeota archaeon]MCG2724122.1 type II methionyl aminopeptidase [archaeon]
MDTQTLDCYMRAGKIASQVREKSKKWIVSGAKLLDAAEKIESEITALGGELAFPANISLNEIAAHYTPIDNDSKVFQEGDMVKIDLGVHVEGYIADTAVTIYLGSDKKKLDLVDASKSALQAAISVVRPGAKIFELSGIIEATIRKSGFFPIANLTGHYLGKYIIHGAPSIPNVMNTSKAILNEGDVIAIEPFATDGSGEVKDTSRAMIFSFIRDVSPRSDSARNIQLFAKKLNGLPFSSRSIICVKGMLRENGLRELVSLGGLHTYPPLKEVVGGCISQAEHTVIVADEPIVTTK